MKEELPKRKKIRLDGYDYSQAGCYFITICVKESHEMLGKVVGAALGRPHIELSRYGEIVLSWINRISEKYPQAYVQNQVIMPNHIHMILTISQVNGRPDAAPTIGRIIGYYKYQTTKEINITGFWQRSYHDHIIRNDEEYLKIWQYIDENPTRWSEDKYYVSNTGN